MSDLVSLEAWDELTLGRANAIEIGPAGPPSQLILPGAFNPLHDGHRAMARRASEIVGQHVGFELSVVNVDKPPLEYDEAVRRVDQFGTQDRLWLTRAATFVDKSRLFADSCLIVGADTVSRIADPNYYAGDRRRCLEAIRELKSQNCRLLVFGRLMKRQFTTLDDLDLPGELLEICQGVSEQQFRADVSSTQLRWPRGSRASS